MVSPMLLSTIGTSVHVDREFPEFQALAIRSTNNFLASSVQVYSARHRKAERYSTSVTALPSTSVDKMVSASDLLMRPSPRPATAWVRARVCAHKGVHGYDSLMTGRVGVCAPTTHTTPWYLTRGV